MRSGRLLHYHGPNPLYHLSTEGQIDMYLHLSQSPYSVVCQPVASFLLRVGSLDTGTGIILLLPQIAASGDRPDEAIVPVRIEVKGFTIAGAGTIRTKEALAFA